MIFFEGKLSKHDKDRIRSAWHNKHNPLPPPKPPEPRLVIEGGRLGLFDACILLLVPLSIGIAIGFTICKVA